MKKLKKERKKYTIEEILELTGCKIEENHKIEEISKKDINNIILDGNTTDKKKYNEEISIRNNNRQKIKPKSIYNSNSQKKKKYSIYNNYKEKEDILTGSLNTKLEVLNKTKNMDKINHNNNEKDKEKISQYKEYNENDNNINNLKGLVNNIYFKNKLNKENEYDLSEFEITDVLGDGNCGYRAFALQLYENEEEYQTIRDIIYNFLDRNKNKYKDFNFEYEGNIIDAAEYIAKIKNNYNWMGDLEISACHLIFNACILVFEIDINDKLKLLNSYGNISDDKLVLTLLYINQNHFQVIYEKGHNAKNTIKYKLDKDKIDDINNEENLEPIKIKYPYFNKYYTYEDIFNYITSYKSSGIGTYPEYITIKSNYTIKKNLKNNLRKLCKRYDIDDKTHRLIKIINLSNNPNKKDLKKYYVAYEFEKKNIVNTGVFNMIL